MPQEKIKFKNHQDSIDDLNIQIEKAKHPKPGTKFPIKKNACDEKDYTSNEEGVLEFIISPSNGTGVIYKHKIETEHEYEFFYQENICKLRFNKLWQSGPFHDGSTTNVEVGVNDTKPVKPTKQKKNNTEKV